MWAAIGRDRFRASVGCGAGLVAWVVVAGVASGAPGGFVEASSSFLIQAPVYGDFKGDSDASGRITVTGPLTSAGSSMSGASAGQFHSFFGSTEVFANPTVIVNAVALAFHGSLGARAQLASDADVGAVPAGAINYRFYEASGSSSATWQDVATFRTDNPLGSLYTLKVRLDTNLSADVDYDPAFVSSSWSAGASASLTWDGPTDFTLGTSDVKRGDNLPGGPSESERNTNAYVERIVFIPAGEPTVVTLTGALGAGVQMFNINAGLDADASHTALFSISTDDPLASYTTESGEQFATNVPEPTTLSLAAGGILAARRRRRHIGS